MDKEDAFAKISTEYPNEGRMTVYVKKAADVWIRPFAFMGTRLDLRVDGKSVPCVYRDGMLYLPNMQEGARIELRHPMETVIGKETVQEREFEVYWRGADVVKITPEGEHLRLYQRDRLAEKYLPGRDDAAYKETDLSPTQQKR